MSNKSNEDICAENMLKNIEANSTPIPMKPSLTQKQKYNLLMYLLVSAISFTLFVAPSRAGVSVLLFMIIQAGWLYYLKLPKTQILMLAPIFVLALNAFISANPMWQLPNLIVAAVLYAFMAVWIVYGISFKNTSPTLFLRFAEVVGNTFLHSPLPFKWSAGASIKKLPVIRRVLAGVVISIPVLFFLIVMLANADAIFSHAVEGIFIRMLNLIHLHTIGRVLFGFIVGLYLFGILYCIFTGSKEHIQVANRQIKGDCVILGVVLTSVLLVYTLFVAIQFRYLFAPPYDLPYGLNFVTYARRGFFELLVLTFLNIAFILAAVWLTKSQTGRGATFIKWMCMYLCAVTVVLLVSSFYRMWLYGASDGLTRMRTLVFGFLIFEGIGLVFTFFYIMRPKFNIVLVYCLIALSYYMVLNVVPLDRIIAREQVNRYVVNGNAGGLVYATRLSADAAPEIARLLDSDDPHVRYLAQTYFYRIQLSHWWNWESGNVGWRQWNISQELALRLGE